MPKPTVKKVLVIGSGPIVIGQAAEFDYAGAQACKALREEGVISVLVNSNPATIMTDQGIADVVYIEPLTVDVLERIIARERPDGLLPTLGGQTGLNLAVEIAEAGILEKYGVRLLGTSLETIRKAEDRELFKKMLEEIGEPVPESAICHTIEEGKAFVDEIGLPVVIRPAYTLGGTGGGFATTPAQLDAIMRSGLLASPIHQVLVERSVAGWKEIEYEVMRDADDNCITVCNMENIDPMGVHTGDSIVVAPSQTLSDKEYQMLRSASLRIIRALGIEGGCNIQMALDPDSFAYYIIEVNPRVSRSSALASKATGYPIARVAAKIAVGRRLTEIANAVTAKTTAAFEPALDYCVVKIPRWPFDKFTLADRSLGTQMKATGEVMAIDRSFEAALQKAVRSLEIGGRSLLWEDKGWHWESGERGDVLRDLVRRPTDQRLWAVFAALRRGATLDELHDLSKIDRWFLRKFERIVEMERRLLAEDLTPALLRQAKRLGFSDSQIGALTDRLTPRVRELRQTWGLRPVYKMVDTCAGEFEAVTPYFYGSYDVENEAPAVEGPSAVVIGSGPIRIGQGIEFDYCSVHSAWALQEAGVSSIMINSNPETVSTDFDTSSRLYFESLDQESVLDILENESKNDGLDGQAHMPPAIVQFGGQTAINLAEPLYHAGCPIIGSDVESIDLAEDRRRCEDFLSRLGIPQPPGAGVHSVDEALCVAERIGYPVLVRPSYVLGGRAMEIVNRPEDLVRYVGQAAEIWARAGLEGGSERPILIDKYLEGKECEVDAVCDGEQVLIPGIMEHIERAGVHSGDSFAVYPGLNLSEQEVATLVDYATRIGLGMDVRGLVNVQFVIYRGQVYVLEVNPRGSRTVPFISKVTGVPMVRVATNIMLGHTLREQGYEGGLCKRRRLVAVKAPVFSMSKLIGADTYLGPEMKSTGEVMGLDYEFTPALAKALIGAGMWLPPRGALLLSIADRDKPESLPIIAAFHKLGYAFYATEGTARFLEGADMSVERVVGKISDGSQEMVELIRDDVVQGVLNTITGGRSVMEDGFHIRRAAAEKRIPCLTSLDTARALAEGLARGHDYSVLSVAEYLNGVREG